MQLHRHLRRAWHENRRVRKLLKLLAFSSALLPVVTVIPPGIKAQQPIVSAGQFVGQISAISTPSSWAITAASPSSGTADFAISGSGVITVTTAGAAALAGQTGTITLTVVATNANGQGNAASIVIQYAAGNFSFNIYGTNGTAGWNIGTNLEAIVYYGSNPMYADISYTFDGNNAQWDTAGGTGAAPLDVSGGPLIAAQTFFPVYATGTYTLTWTGSGTLAAGFSCSTGAITVLSNPGTAFQTNSALVTMTGSLTLPGNTANWCILTSTPPTTNIHLTAGSANTIGGIWYKPFIQSLAPFSTIRFMQPLQSNGFQPIVDWVQRTQPTSGISRSTTWSGNGMAYEDVISLANLTGKDVWINLPITSTDNFVCRLARLFRYGESGANDNGVNCSGTASTTGPYSSAPINPRSKIYVEISNEVWNFSFPQLTYALCMATGFQADGVTPCPLVVSRFFGAGAVLNGSGVVVSLNNHIFSDIASNALNTGTTNWSTGLTRANNLLQLLSYRDGLIFKRVFANHTQQIVNVHNVQSAAPTVIDGNLATMNTSPYGPVNTYLDALAFAPYITLDNEATQCDTVADCAGTLLLQTQCGGTSPANTCLWIQEDVAESKKYNIGGSLSGTGGIVMYEGGQNLLGTGSTQLNTQSGTGMYAVYKSFLSTWDSQVGRANPAVFYVHINPWVPGGFWGNLLNLQDPGSQKYDALISSILIPGDVNMDGVVNQADCTIIKNNLNQTFASVFGSATVFWQQGDLNHDGIINAADEAIVNSHLTSGSCP